MPTVLTFNRALSAVVGRELLTELTELRSGLSRATPWGPEVAGRFSRLGKIAKTAQLRGVHRALTTLTESAKRLADKPSEEILAQTLVLAQAVLVHLQEWINDHKNTPLRLARPLQQLNQLLGITTSPMLSAEMFLPFIPEECAPARPSENTKEEFIAAVRDHVAVYQACLMKLIKEGDLAQLSSMRQALVTLEPKNPHVGFRVFFEAAIAIFDSLQKEGSLDNSTKWIVGKIAPELNMIIQGAIKSDDDVLSAMLYLIAKADSDTSARVRKLQDQYSLNSFMAETNTVEPAIIDKFLSVLVTARELWQANTDLDRMLGITGDLKSKAGHLHNPGFVTTISAFHDVLEAVVKKTVVVDEDALALEGASALLLLEMQVREGSNLDNANQSASRMYKLIGKDTGSAAPADRHAAASILHQLASEIQDDLDQLEPRLLEMLNGHHDGEADLRHGLVKITKILRIFGKSNALSRAFQLFEESLATPATSEGKSQLAGRYTQLGVLVEHLKTSEKSAFTAAQKWIDNLPRSQEAPLENIPDNVDVPNDTEMLEIFLEEAEGIVIDVAGWVRALRADPTEHDTLANIRRGYHTLKGSGRMVGLSRFGDMAYVTELLLNNWLTNKSPASPALLDFLDKATTLASVHVVDFKTIGTSAIEFDDLEALAIGLGGTPLSDAPQNKKAKSRTAMAQPAAAEKAIAVEADVVVPEAVKEPLVVVYEAPSVFVLEETPSVQVPAFNLDTPFPEAPVFQMEPATTPELPVQQAEVVFDDILKTPDLVLPTLVLPPLEKPAPVPVLPIVLDTLPAEVKPSIVADEAPASRRSPPKRVVPETKKPVAPPATTQTPPRRKPRETPAAWQNRAVENKKPVAPPLPTAPQRQAEPVQTAPDAFVEQAYKPQAPSLWSRARAWFSSLFGAKK
jgi:hypothetical protein